MRSFALVDCNNFYASCEKAFAPRWEGRPLVILSNNDGCVVALTQEAKALGITRGAPYFKIRNILERAGGRAFSSNYALYGDMSRRVMSLLGELVPAVEIYSIDECFLDLTGIGGEVEDFAWCVKKTIWQGTRIPVSVGVASTRTLAKAANRCAKTGRKGVCVLSTEAQREEILRAMAPQEIWGIGPRLSARLMRRGVTDAYTLSRLPDEWVKEHLGGVYGLRLVRELRGECCLEMENIASKKEILSSRSFGIPVTKKKELDEAVSSFAARAAEKLRRQKSLASLMTLFFYTDRFKKGEPQYGNTASFSFDPPTAATAVIIKAALELSQRIYRGGFSYKKCGVLLSGIFPASDISRSLFSFCENEKEGNISQVLDAVNEKWGRDTLAYAAQGARDEPWHMRRQMLSPRWTTVWDEIPVIRL